MKRKLFAVLTAAFLSNVAPQFSTLFAQTTAFTYQGRLNNNGAPANGLYDVQASLQDAGSNSVAGPVVASAAVSNGLFTIVLDFGAAQLTGADRWLQLAVRTNGGGAFTPIFPRQPLTSAPYAVQAANAASAGSVAAGNITGTIGLTQLPVALVTNGATGVNISGTFTGNGGSLTNLDSSYLTGPLTVSALVSLGHINDGGNAIGVAVSGNFAYLCNYVDGLRVYNIANPTNPVSIGHIDDGGFAYGVAVSGNFAYLANLDDGLRVYNISNPTNPVSIGHIDDGGFADGVAVSGNFAYLANQDDGLRVYNISNPTNPVSIGHIDDGGSALGVAVSGNFAYLANGNDGLRVYNIANPTNPVSIGHIDDGGTAYGMAVSGNFAYLANQDDGLRVYNISNPTNPVSIGHIDDGGNAIGVAVSGNLAYLANGNDGLRVYNIANPTNPVSIGHINDSGGAAGVAVSGNFAYLAGGSDGLRVYGLGVASAQLFQGDGRLLTGLNADNITSGTLNAGRIPNLDGSKIASGVLDTNRIPSLDASKITSGTLADARLSSNVALRAGGNAFTGNQAISSGSLTIAGVGSYNSGMLLTGNSDSGTGFALENTAAGGHKFALLSGGSGNSVGAGGFGLYDESSGTYRLAVLANGNVGIGTTDPTNKLHVAGGVSATAFISTSDRNAKENFAPVSPKEVLNKVAALPITTWNFKTMNDGRHIGPMAQDFYAAFGLGGGDTTITSTDPDGVALAAIKGLNEKLTDELKRRDAENAELKQRLEKLEWLMNEKNRGGK